MKNSKILPLIQTFCLDLVEVRPGTFATSLSLSLITHNLSIMKALNAPEYLNRQEYEVHATIRTAAVILICLKYLFY